MTQNISEFERTKPKQTLKLLNDTINHYKSKTPSISDISNHNDELVRILYVEFTEKLMEIKYKFLTGE